MAQVHDAGKIQVLHSYVKVSKTVVLFTISIRSQNVSCSTCLLVFTVYIITMVMFTVFYNHGFIYSTS